MYSSSEYLRCNTYFVYAKLSNKSRATRNKEINPKSHLSNFPIETLFGNDIVHSIPEQYIELQVQDLPVGNRYDQWWIGANDITVEGEYRWLNGEAVAAEVFSWFTGMYIIEPLTLSMLRLPSTKAQEQHQNSHADIHWKALVGN